jgi:hypothetical protein
MVDTEAEWMRRREEAQNEPGELRSRCPAQFGSQEPSRKLRIGVNASKIDLRLS